jgi:hypothetical protein
MRRSWLIIIGVLGSLAAFALTLHFTLPGVNNVKNIAAIVQASTTALAVGIAGAFAGYKLRVFRDFQPHLTITQDISHRRIGDSYWHIAVTATMRNTSKVEVEIQKRIFRLQQISPISDDEVKELYTTVAR